MKVISTTLGSCGYSLEALRHWFTPPIFPDEERKRLAGLLHWMLFVLLAVNLFNMLALAIFAPETLPTFWINGVFLGVTLLSFGLMRSGRVRAAGFVLCFSFWGLLVTYIAESGGVTSPAFGLFDIVIIVTAILLGVRGAVGFGLLCIASAVVLYGLGSNGWLHSIEQAPTPARAFATHTTILIVLTLLMAISGHSVWEALTRARSGEQRLAEREQAEDALRRALEQQKELVDLKSQFIAMASHDFRTPLSVILTSLSLVEREIGDQLEGSQREALQKRFRRIDDSVQHMTSLLDDVLLVSHADTGKLDIHPERLDVERLCQAFLQEIQLTAAPSTT